MKSLATGCFQEGVITKTFEMLFEFNGQLCDARKGKIFRRIKVVSYVVGLIKVRRS